MQAVQAAFWAGWLPRCILEVLRAHQVPAARLLRCPLSSQLILILLCQGMRSASFPCLTDAISAGKLVGNWPGSTSGSGRVTAVIDNACQVVHALSKNFAAAEAS